VTEWYRVGVGSGGSALVVGCVVIQFLCCRVAVFLSSPVWYLCPPVIVVIILWRVLLGVVDSGVKQFPRAGVFSGEELVKVLGHSGIEFVALAEVCRAQAITCAVSACLAVDAVKFGVVGIGCRTRLGCVCTAA